MHGKDEQTAIESYAASPQQARIRELARRGAEGSFLASCRLRLGGEIDSRRLRQALGRVVARHEILSTVLHDPPELTVPLQRVMPADAGWDEEDWSALADPEVREGRAAAWLAGLAEPVRPRVPALHASLRRLAPDSALLSLSLPAYCADRAALANLVRELFAEYQAVERSGAPGVEPLQYADLAAWLNEEIAAPERAKERDHWRQLGLASWLALRLPHETAPASGASFAVGRALPAALAAPLAELARSTGSSLERVLLGAWQILLARLLGL